MNLSIKNESYHEVRALSEYCGFRSPSRLVIALIDLVLAMVRSHMSDMPLDTEASMDFDIKNLFEDYAEWQRLLGKKWDINQRE